MKVNTLFLCLSLPLFFGSQTIFATAPKIDFEFSPVPSDIKTLDYRLDNLDASVSKLNYALNHLDKNIVLLQIIPLSEAHTSFDNVLDYAIEGLTETLNFDFINFRHILSGASEFYSPAAYEKVQQFLSDNGITQKTKSRKITNNAVIMATPIITNTKLATMPHPNIPSKSRKVYTWELEIPLYIQTHENGKLLQTLRKNVKLKVARCSVEYSAEQMWIDDINFEDYKLGV